MATRYGATSRLPGTTIGGGQTRTVSNNNSKLSHMMSNNRPNSAQTTISPRGSIIIGETATSNKNLINNHNNKNGSRNSSVSRSNTPGIIGGISHNHSYSHYSATAGSSSVSAGNSPNVPRTTQKAMEEFSKPTAAAEARQASTSILAERLRNIVSRHEERVGEGKQNQHQQQQQQQFTAHQQRQMDALHYGGGNSVQQQLDFSNDSSFNDSSAPAAANTNNSNNNVTTTRVVPIESKYHTAKSRVILVNDNSTTTTPIGSTPSNSAPGSAMKPTYQQQLNEQQYQQIPNRKRLASTAWNGGMEYSENDDEEYDDDEEEEESDNEEQTTNNNDKSRKSSVSPQRPPLPKDENQRKNPRSPSTFSTSPSKNNNNSPTNVVPTVIIPGFTHCRDWSRRGMRPDEVEVNEPIRIAWDASNHVEPRNLDTWVNVTDREGSFSCRRCGIPVFPSKTLHIVPRAGHIGFTNRYQRTTLPELCPGEGSKIIIRCARCRAFLADIYDMQSRSVPPLFRVSSWCVWHTPELKVPQGLNQTLGPYIGVDDDDDSDVDEESPNKHGSKNDDFEAMLGRAIQEDLDREIPLTKASDFF